MASFFLLRQFSHQLESIWDSNICVEVVTTSVREILDLDFVFWHPGDDDYDNDE